jgi:hypothetical protein
VRKLFLLVGMQDRSGWSRRRDPDRVDWRRA